MISTTDLFLSVVLLLEIWLASFLLTVAYRLSPFHPLYRIPGPFLAKATYLYEIYFDLIKGGQYTREIQRLHDVYGPLVQINPDGLHSNDPHFVDEVYAGGNRKRNKPFVHVKFLVGALRASAFGTQDHEVHRRLREPLNKFFSRASVSKVEANLHSLVQQLGDKILATAATEEVFEFQDAVSCYTSDVIGLFAFGDPLGFLQQSGFTPNLKRASWPMFTTYYLCRWFEPARYCFEKFGSYVSRFMPKELATYQNLYEREIPARISQIKAENDAAIIRKGQTAFDVLLNSDLPDHDKSEERLQGEAGVFMIAGTDTTSWMLTVATFYILQSPTLLADLTSELCSVVTDPRSLPTWKTLEQLPLLSAVVNETLRLSYGVPGRSSRIATHEDLVYRGCWTPPGTAEPVKVTHVVPRGFNVGMSTLLLHHNESVFPDAERFLPERWIDEDGRRRKYLDRFLFSFSKGSRSCLGMNLAYCEIYLALAMLIVRVYPRMQLYETTIDDVKLYRDLFVPVIKDGRKGVRVFVSDELRGK